MSSIYREPDNEDNEDENHLDIDEIVASKSVPEEADQAVSCVPNLLSIFVERKNVENLYAKWAALSQISILLMKCTECT